MHNSKYHVLSNILKTVNAWVKIFNRTTWPTNVPIYFQIQGRLWQHTNSILPSTVNQSNARIAQV